MTHGKLTHPLAPKAAAPKAPPSSAKTAIESMKLSTKLGDLAARAAMTTQRKPK